MEAQTFGASHSEAAPLYVSANPHYDDHAVDAWFASHGVFVPTCYLGGDPWWCTVGISGVRKRDLANLAILVVEADPWPARLASEQQLSKH